MIDMERYRRRVEEAASYLKRRLSDPPEIAIVLGTGLSSLADSISHPVVIPYGDIPHFPVSSVSSHAGNLVAGRLAEKNVIILQGRVHCYEGFSARDVAFSIRVLSLLGVETAVITNASGGLNPHFSAGSIMVLTDHINLLGDNPLRGPNIDEWGPRFPDLSSPYDAQLVSLSLDCGRDLGIPGITTGTYVCIPGPSLETPAETRFLRQSGGDTVGMSSIPEILVAIHSGMRVLGLSVVANINDPDNLQPILLDDIVEKAQEAEPVLQSLISEIVRRWK